MVVRRQAEEVGLGARWTSGFYLKSLEPEKFQEALVMVRATSNQVRGSSQKNGRKPPTFGMTLVVVGDRVSSHGHIATVRFVGKVAGTNGDWIGAS